MDALNLAPGGNAYSLFFDEDDRPVGDVFADDFLVGVALDRSALISGSPRAELVARSFSSLTAENDMKWMSLHPEPDRFTFRGAEAYVDFGQQHGMAVIGHTLVCLAYNFKRLHRLQVAA